VLKFFDCKFGRIPIADCLKKCPGGDRCLSLPTLMSISWQRPWTGKPSVTQLLNGTRLAYLEIVKDYSVKPNDMAFALLGTRHHLRLDKLARKVNALSEEKLEDEETKGTLDLLVPDETTKEEKYLLYDYKTSGSFKVAKALGLTAVKVPSTTEVYDRSGSWGRAGTPKMLTIWDQNPEHVDMWDWELQLNAYRLKVERIGFPVSRMYIQCTVRDGGTFVAENRGVMKNIYLIGVKRLDDEEVEAYFVTKAVDLLNALSKNELPSPCNEEENWGGNRCKSYCNCWEFCDSGVKLHRE